MKSARRGLGGLGVVMIFVIAAPSPASAHAQLEWTRPVQSAVVSTSPSQVVLHFGEPVEIDFGSLRVIGPNGQRVDSGGTHHPPGDSHAVAIALPPHLPDGTYVVAWRVISADSHPVHGAFVFSVGSAAGASKANALATSISHESGSTAVGVLYWFIRFAAFVGLLFLVGLATTVILVWREGGASRRVGTLLWLSWGTLLASTLLGIAIQGVYAAALPLTDIVRPSLINEVLHTHFGKIELLRLALLLGFIPVVLGLQGRFGRDSTRWLWLVPVEIVLAVGLLLTPGLAGHASTGSDPLVGIFLDLLHLAASAMWLGGLALLGTLLVRPQRDHNRPHDTLHIALSVSALAFTAVLVVVGSGVVQSIRQVGSLFALFHTVYGRTLLVKIGFVVVLIGLGAISRRVLMGRFGIRRPSVKAAGKPGAVEVRGAPVFASGPATKTSDAEGDLLIALRTREDDPTGTIRRLRRSVLAEIAVALIVLAVTALLVNAVPAKQAAGQPFTYSVSAVGVQVNALIDPARAGPGNQFHFYVLGKLGQPQAIPELDASIALPAQSLGPLSIPLVVAGPGHYLADNVDIPVAGTWILTITVRTSAIDEQQVSTPLPIP